MPALIPFLVANEGFNYERSGSLLFYTAIMSAIVQPIFGKIADRTAPRWILPGSILLAGFALALAAIRLPYYAVAGILMTSGFGVAAFHPEAVRQTHLNAGAKRTTSMSVFSVGGNLGFAIAPVIGGFLLSKFGREGYGLVVIPAMIVAVLLAAQFSRASTGATAKTAKIASPQRPDQWFGFSILATMVILRSVAFFGVMGFLPSYIEKHWDASPQTGLNVMSVFLACGIAGSLIGGQLADRIGRKPVIVLGFVLASLTFFWAYTTTNPLIAFAALIVAGVAFNLPVSASVILGQEYLPNSIGTASGVTMGLAVSAGGILSPVLGHIGDKHGLGLVMQIVIWLTVASLVASALMPKIRHERAT